MLKYCIDDCKNNNNNRQKNPEIKLIPGLINYQKNSRLYIIKCCTRFRNLSKYVRCNNLMQK